MFLKEKQGVSLFHEPIGFTGQYKSGPSSVGTFAADVKARNSN